jgi:hypothetical protein
MLRRIARRKGSSGNNAAEHILEYISREEK